ncbi:Rpn family recombination-promoting nuclease/putative transposase [Candidatus Symbiobacter mobilis]|uniref:Transposase (putative) YhgA-like domain-containing protein n=1 Tax=Candidatus Symbiobacter mobilis CR TaxID=946483 RepID=U5N510_9BURK|nr:Rpn family recombination-promoting nuclease/putative transposase [Candidatus Symbiobacter mobilis]AGX86606.1 hypothetical protein Cenrod_0492 [Candidatus Symbiobacter mobilis CR]
MATEHDSSYKFLFSNRKMVRDLIQGFVTDDWLYSLDYDSLEKVPGSYISEDFRQRADDVVWRIKVGGQWVYLYLLIEFQSSVDRYMALRMLVYLGLLYQDLIRRGEVLPNGRLPPVLPIVLYNGAARWTAATEFSELIPPVPGLVERFKPKFQYLLIAKNHYTENTLPPVKNFVAALFRLEQVSSPEALLPLIASLQEWHENDADVRRMFAIWLRATWMRKKPYQMQLPEVDDLQEISIMLSERIEEWAKGYEAKGMQVGIEKGIEQGLLQGMQTGMNQGQHLEAIRTLHKLLAKRFGDVPEALMARIEAAPLEQIEGWFDFALDAPTLESVFADHTGAPLSH